MNRILLALLLVAAAAAGAEAGMVTERWSAGKAGWHPSTLSYRQAKQGLFIVADLSAPALRKVGRVYRARLFFSGVSFKDASFEIQPVDPFQARPGPPTPAGDELKLPGPWFQWFDATDAVAERAGGGKVVFWLKRHPKFDREKTYLEIAYEGRTPKDLPRQVKGVKALYRGGQVFVTFQEIDSPDRGKAEITAGELGQRLKVDYYRPRASGAIRYRVYRHDKPITAANIGFAELLGEALPGSAYNTRHVLDPKARGGKMPAVGLGSKKYAHCLAVRVAVEEGEVVDDRGVPRMKTRPLPPGTGLYVHTVTRPGKAYYAVLTASGGVVNARGVSSANTAGPVEQRVADPEPVMYMDLTRAHAKEGVYHQQYYSFWTTHPLSRLPARYDVIVSYCPERLLRPAPVRIARAQWGVQPVPYWPRARSPGSRGLHLTHTADSPLAFRTGLNDAMDTLKGFDEGTWRPFHMSRQDAILRWMKRRWPVDADRISVYAPCWGCLEVTRGDTYAYLNGYMLAEVTKGFQTFERACAVWGEPKKYESRPHKPNPYRINDVTSWVLANPQKELPFIISRGNAGCHNKDMGWPPFPRFFWAMMKSKRAFMYNPRGKVYGAVTGGPIRLGRDQSVPAFAHCSLDDAIGDGDPWTSDWMVRGSWYESSQLNGYLLWDSAATVDAPAKYEITVWLAENAPLGDCTVDMTPRRCRKFKATPGQKFAWTNTLLPPQPEAKEDAPTDTKAKAKPSEKSKPAAKPTVIQSGPATADEFGLVTVEKLKVTKGRHRVTIRPAR